MIPAAARKEMMEGRGRHKRVMAPLDEAARLRLWGIPAGGDGKRKTDRPAAEEIWPELADLVDSFYGEEGDVAADESVAARRRSEWERLDALVAAARWDQEGSRIVAEAESAWRSIGGDGDSAEGDAGSKRRMMRWLRESGFDAGEIIFFPLSLSLSSPQSIDIGIRSEETILQLWRIILNSTVWSCGEILIGGGVISRALQIPARRDRGAGSGGARVHRRNMRGRRAVHHRLPPRGRVRDRAADPALPGTPRPPAGSLRRRLRLPQGRGGPTVRRRRGVHAQQRDAHPAVAAGPLRAGEVVRPIPAQHQHRPTASQG